MTNPSRLQDKHDFALLTSKSQHSGVWIDHDCIRPWKRLELSFRMRCIQVFLEYMIVIVQHWKRGAEIDPATWPADQGVASLYKSRCTGSSWHSPSPRYTSLGSRSPSLCSLLLLFFSKFIRKRRKIFPFFASPFAFHLHFMFTFYSLQERVCGGTTTLQERFCGASLPARTNLWSVITRKNDFCERQPCPARTTNSRTANFDC